jgi:hypothetical protein
MHDTRSKTRGPPRRPRWSHGAGNHASAAGVVGFERGDGLPPGARQARGPRNVDGRHDPIHFRALLRRPEVGFIVQLSACSSTNPSQEAPTLG